MKKKEKKKKERPERNLLRRKRKDKNRREKEVALPLTRGETPRSRQGGRDATERKKKGLPFSLQKLLLASERRKKVRNRRRGDHGIIKGKRSLNKYLGGGKRQITL